MDRFYQFKIELRDSNPKIWRRIQVPEETSFSELHDIIQLSMGWKNDHLYKFTIKNIKLYDFEDAFDDGTNPSERDSNDTFLDELLKKVKTRFTYIYDFGDHWEHEILLEKILPVNESNTFPVCLDGEGACPPEDCGGIWRYQEILNILADKNHPEYEDVREWIGHNWDPELFDRDRINALLQDYAEQWIEIYQETGEIIENLEGEEDFEVMDPDSYEEDDEYVDWKKFSSPEEVLLDEYEHTEMEDWLKSALNSKKSKEYQIYHRLRNSGFDDQRSKNLILQALSIECFYDLKYGTDHLEDRYEYNLHRLPEPPKELSRLKDALEVLNNSMKGVPFSAIEFVQNDPSAEATSAVLKALRNHSDHQYCWAECTLTPFWYALAAEGHLCEELIDPVIQLYEENPNNSDWLYEQGQYLIGKLAQKYPELTAEQVLEAMEKTADKKTKPYIFYLFDAFYFCDINKFKPRLLALLERNDLSWYEPLVATIAELNITEGLPVLRRKLKNLQNESVRGLWYQHKVVEIEEAINILEGKELPDQELMKPLSLKRETSWQEDLKKREDLFYKKEDYSEVDLPDHFDQGSPESTQWPQFSISKPYIKEKEPGRNDPCHCGSGKKYKKCCMDKVV